MRLESLAIVVVALTSGMAPAQVCPTCPQPNGSPGRRIVVEEWQTPGQYAAPQWSPPQQYQFAAPQWSPPQQYQFAAPQWSPPQVLLIVTYGPPAGRIGLFRGRPAAPQFYQVSPPRGAVPRGLCPT